MKVEAHRAGLACFVLLTYNGAMFGFVSLVVLTSVMLSSFAQAQEGDVDMSTWPRVLTPGTALNPGAGVKVVPIDRQSEVYRLTARTGERPIETVSGGDYMKVTAVAKASGLGPGEAADLDTYAKAGDLHVRTAALRASADCGTVDGEERCRVHKPLTVEAALPYEPSAFVAATMGSDLRAVIPGQGVEQAVAGNIESALRKVNKPTTARTGGPAQEYCDPLTTMASGTGGRSFLADLFSGGSGGGSSGGLFSGGGPSACAMNQAREAYQNAQKNGRKVADFMVVTDFSDGGTTGKMWFMGPMGNKVNLGVPNPLEVSRGSGGFGAGVGSQRTPDGAVITRAYRPPRGGNILNGIELDGLEAGNRDIHGRGVLLHGWSPGQPTQGCLGIAGTLQTRSGTNAVLGGVDHFKTLAEGPFRQGGVVMYNFTPAKASDCK